MSSVSRRILVVTVVHHPLDARIWHRQLSALLDRGWQVTYAAPWSDHGQPLPQRPGLTLVDLPRAQGRRRWAAQRAARRLLRDVAADHDVVLLHDPELVPATIGLSLPPVVWDVHEDPAAAVRVRTWIPAPLRLPTAGALRLGELLAERHVSLLLADQHYAERFRRPHPVVLNTTQVPADPPTAGTPDQDGVRRVVYLGSVTLERGAAELVEVGRRIREETQGRLVLEVLGPAHGAARELMSGAHAAGTVRWHGFVPNPDALARIEGALAGLSLLHDEENFRPSMPTKVVEYLARGVPVITTPLPVAVDLVTRSGGGVVVPFGDVDAVVEQLLRWYADPGLASAVGRRGHARVRAELDWGVHAEAFAQVLEHVASGGSI